MRLLFQAISQYLLTLFTGQTTNSGKSWLVNYIRIWNNQDQDLLDGKDNPEFVLKNDSGYTPPLFIEFPDNIVWSQLGNGNQIAEDLRIKIHILHEFYDAGDGTMEQNLDALDIAQQIFDSFDEWMPDTMVINNISYHIPVGVMDRIGDYQDKKHPMVYHFVQEYKTTWVDSDRNRPIAGSIAGNIGFQSNINVVTTLP